MEKNDELFEVTMKTASKLIKMSEDAYQECKYVLLAQVNESPRLQNYLNALFDYVESRRSLMIEQKAV